MSTMFQQRNTVELDTLGVPGDKWRLDLLLQPGHNSVTAEPRRGFETLDACWAEDQRRARALRRPPEELYAGVKSCDPAGTAALLSQGVETRRIQKCSASAAYMRERRLAFLGSILKLVDDNPHFEVALITVSHPAWYFNFRYNWPLLNEVPGDFSELIDRIF